MNPFYFGSGQHRLFGIYIPPLARRTGARSIVLCQPWGQEYLRAHRSMRQLASTLAAAGHHVLRFDYFGTGDSAGEMAQASLGDWEEDIALAIEELRDTTAAAKVALVGLRLGAALAARVAARRPEDVDALVLWDPVVGGDEYLGELVSGASYAMDCVPRPADAGGGYDVLGFPLTGTLMKEIAAIDLCELVPAMPARMLVLASQALPSHQRLEAALARRPAAEGALERIECEPAWLEKEDLGAGAIPVAILQRITGWFG